MAYRKKETTSKDVFMLTVPLKCEPWQSDKLDTLFRCALNIEHGLMAEKLRALCNMERTREWRSTKAALDAEYKKPQDNQDKKQLKKLKKQSNAIVRKYGLTASAFEKAVKKYQHYYKQVNSNTAQKLAANVWKSFEAYLYGKGKEIRFKPLKQFTAMHGKSNKTGIRYSRGCILVGKGKNPMKLPLKWNKVFEDGNDRYCYETQAMQRDIHYCGIKRVWYPEGWKYFAQLCLSGEPPVKVDHLTGEVLHPIGDGDVGIDIGPQTVAVVGLHDVSLNVLAEDVEQIHQEVRRIQRAMDRSRKATNPEMFYSDERVVPLRKLPKHLLTSRGRRIWVMSKRYKALESRLRYLQGLQATRRKHSHQRLANQLLAYGNSFYVEEMHWQALAKRRKEDKTNVKGKHLSKKRFGKSIANKSPATFVKTMTDKVFAMGGTLQEINTIKARASQYEHINHTYKKKKLSHRWAHLPNGDVIQRDLYSAFLIQCVNNTLDGFNDAMTSTRYLGFKLLHDAEVGRLKQRHTPNSTGIKCTA